MKPNKKDPYLENRHTSEVKTIEVKTFAINDIPVCTSWFGCEKHPREACQFLLQRHFGMILVCGLTGEYLITEPDIINAVPPNCPIHFPKEK